MGSFPQCYGIWVQHQYLEIMSFGCQKKASRKSKWWGGSVGEQPRVSFEDTQVSIIKILFLN